MKALKKAQKQTVSIESDELRHKSLHSGPGGPGKTIIKPKNKNNNNNHHHRHIIITIIIIIITTVFIMK